MVGEKIWMNIQFWGQIKHAPPPQKKFPDIPLLQDVKLELPLDFVQKHYEIEILTF